MSLWTVCRPALMIHDLTGRCEDGASRKVRGQSEARGAKNAFGHFLTFVLRIRNYCLFFSNRKLTPEPEPNAKSRSLHDFAA